MDSYRTISSEHIFLFLNSLLYYLRQGALCNLFVAQKLPKGFS